MVNPLKVTTVSTSIALVATQAIAAVGESHDIQVARDFEVSAELDAQIDAALAKKDVREEIGSVFDTLARRFVAEEGRLEDQLFPTFDGEEKSLREIFLAQTDFVGRGNNSYRLFSTSGSGVCYTNCHNACHRACHGSRGWR